MSLDIKPRGRAGLAMLAAHLIGLAAADIIESSDSALRKDRRNEPGNEPPEIPRAPSAADAAHAAVVAKIRAENAERRLREIAKRQPKVKP
jgi:hypothetical protein